MTIGFQPKGFLICPWQTPGEEHEVKWVAASFGDDGTTEHYRCETCPRALHVTHGVIASEPGREVVIRMETRRTGKARRG